jgi:oligopeptide transport system substrate-binding protein
MLDLMQTTHGNNDGKYSNPTFDKLMSESRNQVDAEARNKLYVRPKRSRPRTCRSPPSIST